VDCRRATCCSACAASWSASSREVGPTGRSSLHWQTIPRACRAHAWDSLAARTAEARRCGCRRPALRGRSAEAVLQEPQVLARLHPQAQGLSHELRVPHLSLRLCLCIATCFPITRPLCPFPACPFSPPVPFFPFPFLSCASATPRSPSLAFRPLWESPPPPPPRPPPPSPSLGAHRGIPQLPFQQSHVLPRLLHHPHCIRHWIPRPWLSPCPCH